MLMKACPSPPSAIKVQRSTGAARVLAGACSGWRVTLRPRSTQGNERILAQEFAAIPGSGRDRAEGLRTTRSRRAVQESAPSSLNIGIAAKTEFGFVVRRHAGPEHLVSRIGMDVPGSLTRPARRKSEDPDRARRPAPVLPDARFPVVGTDLSQEVPDRQAGPGAIRRGNRRDSRQSPATSVRALASAMWPGAPGSASGGIPVRASARRNFRVLYPGASWASCSCCRECPSIPGDVFPIVRRS